MSRLVGFSRRWHALKAMTFIPEGARVLHVLCNGGGIVFCESHLDEGTLGLVRVVRGAFPKEIPCGEGFEAVAVLDALDEIPEAERTPFLRELAEWVAPGGRLIVTRRGLGARNGLDPVSALSEGPVKLVNSKRFQLGLSRVMVFERESGSAK